MPGRSRLSGPLFLSALLCCAVLFALITWAAAVGSPVRRADERLELHLVGHGPRQLTEVLADLGAMPVALPVLALALLYALVRGHRRQALAGAVTMVLVPALVVPLKLWIDRPGPLTEATGYYPSGHTATAMVAYGTAAVVLAPFAGARRTAPVAVLLTVATGAGLLLRGYHWPLDVLGSVALCGVLLLLLARVVGLISRSTRRSSSKTPAG